MEEILLKNLEVTSEKIELYVRKVEDTYSFLSFLFKLRPIYFITSLLVSAVIKIKNL
jgi:hypothetical protein